MTTHDSISGTNPEPDTKNQWKAISDLAMSINNASIDGMIALDKKLKIITCNAVIESWSGQLCDSFIGKTFFEAFPSAHAQNFDDAFKQALNGLKSFLPSESGNFFEGYFETHIVPLKDSKGNIKGILLIIHDVAHRVKAENRLKELNEELKEQYAELQHASAEIATFAKIAAHDLMEPVRKIYIFGEQIKKNEAANLSDSGKGNIRRMQTSLQRLGLLMDDVVSFLTLSTAKKQFEEVDLNSILSKVLNDFKEQIEQSETVVSAESLPVISGIPLALEQIFRQLLSNILKFRRSDVTPELSIRCNMIQGKDLPFDEARSGKMYYCLSFRDNGIGFESGYRERIFELFETLHPQGAYKGSGKGLAIALKATRLHHGFMKAESKPGAGSTFYCYLPV